MGESSATADGADDHDGHGDDGDDEEEGVWRCTICMDTEEETDPTSICRIRPCLHSFCAPCIVRWSRGKESPKCPLCQTAFTYLMVRRRLDGTLHEHGQWGCESVLLLSR